MFNRAHLMSRVDEVRRKGIAMTNYGVVIAYLQNILDRISH